MIRTVILDDERLAISKLRHVLAGFEDIEIVADYDNPVTAIGELGQIMPDLLLLDINMPELSGLRVAEQALELAPDMHIVFVTAYPDYALEAFEIAALDYLVKPATKERVHKVVQRIRKRLGDTKPAHSTGQATISTFGRLDIVLPGSARQPVFRSAKVKELLCYMLVWHGKKVGKSNLMDALWPDMDHKRALGNLNTCLYQLRKNVMDGGMGLQIAYAGDGYKMLIRDAFVDLHAFNELTSSDRPLLLQEMKTALELYKGELLSEEDYSWAAPERNACSHRFRTLLVRYLRENMSLRRYEEIIPLAQKHLDADPYWEELWKIAIHAHLLNGERGLAAKKYEQMQKLYREELGVELREALENI